MLNKFNWSLGFKKKKKAIEQIVEISKMERSFKECNRHEKRPYEDDILRVCQTCGRNYYTCDLCRNAKGVDAPLNICI